MKVDPIKLHHPTHIATICLYRLPALTSLLFTAASLVTCPNIKKKNVLLNIQQLGSEVVVLTRYILMTAVATPSLVKNTPQLEFPAKQWIILVISAVFVAGTTTTNYEALTHLSPLDTIALHYINPVYTLILGSFILKVSPTVLSKVHFSSLL